MTGVGQLLWLAVRRDRIFATGWLIVLWLVCGASATATTSIYPSAGQREIAAQAINASPGIVAMYGPILDPQSLGELAMAKMTVTYAVVVAVMMLFLVRRHTRAEEETGLSEMLGGTAIARQAPLAAALTFASAVSVLLGVGVAVVNTVGGLPLAGSVAFGACWAGTALVGAAISALVCQLSASARTCAAYGGAALGVLFALRAVGDTTSADWLSWLSPFGWNTQLSAYSNPNWWVLSLYVVAALVLGSIAIAVAARRDLGAGVIHPKPGAAEAQRWLRGPAGLDWLLHRTMLVFWTLAVAAMGATFGAITPSLDAFESPEMREILVAIGGAAGFREVLLSAILSISAVIVVCFAIAVITGAASAEARGLTEEVLATGTSRWQLFASTALLAVAGSTWLLLVVGSTMAWGLARAGGGEKYAELTAAALNYLPAGAVLVGLAILLFSLARRWAVAGWAVLILAVTLGQIGESLNLPQWLINLSPYTHTPVLPIEEFDLTSTLWLSGIATVLFALAAMSYLRRDIG